MDIDGKPTFGVTPLSSPICKWALPLVARKDGKYYGSGSSVIIGPQLAITARHVILDFMQRLGTKEVAPNRFKHKFYLQAAQVLDDGDSGVLWNVSRIWRSAHTDVAFLFLEPTVSGSLSFPWPKLAMDLRPLQIGSRVTAFGYPQPRFSFDNSGNRRIVEWEISPHTSTGVITDVFYERRDSGLLNFPCYQTNARFAPSMSGGPVFNESGHLSGLVCSGFDTSSGEDEAIGFFSAIWPSMATPININRDGFPKDAEYPILELARDGFLAAVGWENIIIDISPRTGKTRVSYKHD